LIVARFKDKSLDSPGELIFDILHDIGLMRKHPDSHRRRYLILDALPGTSGSHVSEPEVCGFPHLLFLEASSISSSSRLRT